MLSYPFRHGLGRVFALMSLVLVLATLLPACGSASNTSNYGGTLTVAPSPTGDYTRNFNVFASGSVLSGTQGLIYETLLFFNREDGSVKPWLASSYQLSNNATTITFKLRSGVKWSDGKPFTSADVVFKLNLIHNHPAVDYSSIWNIIRGLSSPDDQTVVVTIKQPSSPLLWYLGGQTYILPQHLWSNVSNPVTYTNPNPVGTGPYLLKSFSPQLYVFDRNPHFWQPGKPYINEIRYPSFNSNTSADLLLSQGSVDWTGLFTPNVNKTFVSRDPVHNHYWLSPTYANASFAVDTAKVASLLQGAGFRKGNDGIYVDKSGKRLAFNINVVSGWTDWVTDSQILASNLQAVGMDVKVNTISFNAYYGSLQTGTFDTAISLTSPGPTPYFLYNSMLSSSNTAPNRPHAASDFEHLHDPS